MRSRQRLRFAGAPKTADLIAVTVLCQRTVCTTTVLVIGSTDHCFVGHTACFFFISATTILMTRSVVHHAGDQPADLPEH